MIRPELFAKISNQVADNTDIGIILVNQNLEVVYINSWINKHITASGQSLPLSIEQVFGQLSKRFISAVSNACQKGRSAILSNKLNKNPLPLFKTDPFANNTIKLEQLIKIKPIVLDELGVALIEVLDVTENVMREAALVKLAEDAKEQTRLVSIQEARIRSIFESVKDAIVITDERGQLEMINSVAVELLELENDDELDHNICEFIDLINDSLDPNFNSVTSVNMILSMWAKHAELLQLTVTSKEQQQSFPAEISVSQLKKDTSSNYVIVIRDITERKKYQERLENLAKFDSLTGLPNRTLFNDRLQSAINYATRYGHYVAVIFIDLDNFKVINDTLGHSSGDELLSQVAKRITHQLRSTDTIARWGGDEFVVQLGDLNTRECCIEIANKILECLVPKFEINHRQFYITASMGIATYPDCGTEVETLIKAADTAMYSAKASERNTFMFFSDEMNKTSEKRLDIESKLRKSIENDEFKIVIQPQVLADNCLIYGGEVLVRWPQPDDTFITPDEFIPIAEETGLIHQIGQQVLEKSCRFLSENRSNLPESFKLSINISPKQFAQHNFVNELLNVCNKFNVGTQDIELELTEGVLMSNTELALATLQQLKSLGFIISIDDFGTGYSSLAYLRKFPISILKIDRSFIVDLPESAEASGICRSIINLAKNLDLKIIAEGVEYEEQLEFIKSEGGEIIQGYYFSKPLAPDDFIEWCLTDASVRCS